MEQNILMNKWVKNLVVILLAVISLSVFVGVVSAMKDWDRVSSTDPKPTITVSGKGEILATPDIAAFYFSVTEDGKTVKEAQDLATTKTNKAIDFLKSSKIDEKDIQTTGYSISPKYEYQTDNSCGRYPCPSGKSTLVGYTVSQSITVKVRDIAKSGTILAGIGGFEVQNVSGISFTIDDQDALNANARTKAIDDAKAKAQKLAGELGVKIVRITNFSEGYSNPIYYAAGKGDMMSAPAASPAPEIPTGQNTITSNVTITYEVR